jgi:hypothetical protein
MKSLDSCYTSSDVETTTFIWKTHDPYFLEIGATLFHIFNRRDPTIFSSAPVSFRPQSHADTTNSLHISKAPPRRKKSKEAENVLSAISGPDPRFRAFAHLE